MYHSSTSAPVTVTVTKAGVVSSIQAVDTSQILLPGVLTADFTASLGTCRLTAVTAGATCQASVTFTPQYPGLRQGAVQLLDATNVVLGTAYLNGTGLGPLAAFEITSATSQTQSLGRSGGYSVATDSWGNVYTLSIAGALRMTPSADLAANGALGKSYAVTGLDGAYGLAVDAAGNIYIGDYGNQRVVVVSLVGNHQNNLTLNGSVTPYGLALDGAGNLYIADKDNNRVVKTSVAGGNLTPVGSGLKTPTSLALDAAGNLYIADTGNRRVVKIAAGTGVQTVVTGMTGGPGLAVDAAGSIYGINGANQVLAVSPATGTVNVLSTVPLLQPQSLAVDMQGNVLIAEFNGRSLRVNRHEDPNNGLTFTFKPLVAGSSETTSIVVENVGNQSLAVPPVSGTDAAVAAGGSSSGLPFQLLNGTGTCFAVNQFSNTTLQSGARCQLGILFSPPEPTTGKTQQFSDSVTLNPVDQFGNEVLAFTGVSQGLQMTVAVSSVTPTYGKAVTATIRLSPQTLVAGSSIIYLLDGISSAQIPVPTGVAVVPLGILDAGAHTFEVDLYPSGQNSVLITKTVNITVAPAPLTVTAANSSRYYGTLNPPLSGRVFGATAIAQADGIYATYSTAATVTSGVGTYAIVPQFNDPNNKLVNYNYVVNNGTLTVHPSPLVITPDGGKSKSYGQLFTAFTGSISGPFRNGDTATVAYASKGAPATAAGGTYDIIVGSVLFNKGSASNYAITTASAKAGLIVTPVALTITPNGSLTKTYGQTFKSFTGTVTGLQNGDVLNVTYGSGGAAQTAAVGTYDIAVAGYVFAKGVASSYTVTQNAATGGLTVQPAQLKVAATSSTRSYGSANPLLGGTIAGALPADNISATYTTTAISTTPAGSQVPIVPALVPNSALSNYTPVLVNGTLSITQALLTVSANNQSSVYGAPLPALTGTLAGAVNAAAADGITVSGVTTATSLSAPNNYNITPQINDLNHALSNYKVTTLIGTLTITPAPLTIAADNQTRSVGQPNPPLTGTVTGMVAGDGISVSYTTPADVNSPAGTYPITPILNDPQKKLGNYIVTSANGTLTVTN